MNLASFSSCLLTIVISVQCLLQGQQNDLEYAYIKLLPVDQRSIVDIFT